MRDWCVALEGGESGATQKANGGAFRGHLCKIIGTTRTSTLGGLSKARGVVSALAYSLIGNAVGRGGSASSWYSTERTGS